MKLLKLANMLQDIAIILTASITVPFLAFNALASYEPETAYIAPKEPIVLVETVKPVEETSIVIQASPMHEETFKVTAYCLCVKCCGIWSKQHSSRINDNTYQQLTCTSTIPVEGRTIAADPEVIPFGTEVEINGHVYVVEDTGSAVKGNHIDLFMESHQEALAWGVQYITVRWN